MTGPVDPALQALADAAVQILDASAATIAARTPDGVSVAAVAGDAAYVVGEPVTEDSETLGFVFVSAQPSAAVGDDERPVVCVPCLTAQGVVGAFEAARDRGATAFGTAEIDAATALADVAAAVLAAGDGAQRAPSAAELATELARLEQADPLRFQTVAALTRALLSHG
jgi:hypothetical protein